MVVCCCPSPHLTGITHCPDPSPAAFSGPVLHRSGHHHCKAVHASKRSVLPQSHAHQLMSNCMTAVTPTHLFHGAHTQINNYPWTHGELQSHLQAHLQGQLGSLLPQDIIAEGPEITPTLVVIICHPPPHSLSTVRCLCMCDTV
jgi:hypothetical protein